MISHASSILRRERERPTLRQQDDEEVMGMVKKVFGGLVIVCLVVMARLLVGSEKRLQVEERPQRVVALIKFHKVGGTSVAASLSRAMFCGDARFRDYRKRTHFVLGSLCGNYDGHYGTIVYRFLGVNGLSMCLGTRPLVAALFRNPVPRFISRLYYELGGRPDLLLGSPFAKNVETWTIDDIDKMEAITCQACLKINNGHCAWKGGLCDNPQEYTVVLSGGSGSLETALSALKRDFQVIGILENLHTFFTLLAHALDWPFDALLYTSRKVHSLRQEDSPCSTSLKKSRRLSERHIERLKKKATTAQAKDASSKKNISWSGNFPLLGWNQPNKAPLSQAVIQYLESRNSDDMKIYNFAKSFQERHRVDVHTFDALQTFYSAGIIPNAQGYFHFCDWRSEASDHNTYCQQCADSLATRPCRILLLSQNNDNNIVLERHRCRSPDASFTTIFLPSPHPTFRLDFL